MTERRPTSGETIDDPRVPAAVVVGVIAGVLGVLASFVPGLFWLAWLLGAVAILTAVPVFRRGPSDSNYGAARIALFAGALAVVVGVLNLGITLDWFTYFTTDDARGPR